MNAPLTSGADLLLRRLADYFSADAIKWKPQAVKGNRALALAYIQTRAIMDRLDDVVGVEGWRDAYEIVDGGCVLCRLSVRVTVGGAWITKSDVGSPSEQPDAGDRMKSAFSDAMKRAAVKFGIGRYLARMPQQWCDYDPAGRRFVREPQVPRVFLPQSVGKPAEPLSRERVPGLIVGGVERINTAEGEILDKRLREANVSLESFNRHYDIPQLGYLPAVLFKEAAERLDRHIAEKSKKATAKV